MGVMTAIAIGSTLVAGYSAYKANQQAKGMQAMSEQQYNEVQAQKAEQDKKLEAQKEKYRQFKFKNPYATVKNMYAGLENVYEDLRVGTQAAEFQMEQGTQQRANVLQGLRGAAGGSGIAGLAQALANQGALQARQISTNLEQQELRNEAMRAQGQMQLQQMEAQGATAADMARRGGEAMVQEAEASRQSTLLGIEYGGSTGANAAVQQAMSNQMSAMASQMSAWSDMSSSFMNIGTTAAGEVDWSKFGKKPQESDRKLKKNINLIGKSPSGLNIYSFEYKNSKYGEGLFQGVMSDEVPREVVETKNGYDIVDYNMLDVEFKQI